MSLTETLPLDNVERARIHELAGSLRRREIEGLRLYRPWPRTLVIHDTKASQVLLRGGNRSGKTTTCAAEVASAATGIPLLDYRDCPIPFRYPRNRPLDIWVTGYDETHIGLTIYPKLFEPGAFDIIKDLKTGRMRVWKPWLPEDAERKNETEPAPPLIPYRFLKNCPPNGPAHSLISGTEGSFTWENKGVRQFKVCRLLNGTTIWAFSSRGKCPQGQAVDLIWIDEDIEFPKHVAEWEARLSDRKGRMFWSAWPHSHNIALVNMSKRALNDATDPDDKVRKNPDVKELVLTFFDNEYIDADEKRKRIKGWTPEEARSRNLGEFSDSLTLVFGEFRREVHTVGGTGCPKALADAIRENRNRPPRNWTHFLFLDPGTTQPAVGFAAIPPPEEFGDHVVVYDEIYTQRADADALAKEIKAKSEGVLFEAFVIDGHAARIKPTGFPITVLEHYIAAFERHKLRSATTASGFMIGSDNITARNMLVREWLRLQPETKHPTLLLVDENTPNMQVEFGLYKKKVVKDEVRDDVVDAHNHLMDGLGYFASTFPRYVWREERKERESPAWALMREMDKRAGKKKDTNYLTLGAGALN